MMTETQAWSLKFNEVANLIRHLKSRKPLNSTDELWLKSLKSDAKQIIGNLKKLAAKDPAAAQAVKRFSQELRAFDTARATQNGGIKMNTIKQKMNYHAREYQRLKAMDDNDVGISEVNKTYRRCYEQVANMVKYYENALNAKTEVIFKLGKLQDFAKKSNDPKVKNLAQQHYDEMMKKYSAVERKYR